MNRLILFEGLPGSGKSTFSQEVYLQLYRQDVDVRWFAEDQRPHPLIEESLLTEIGRADRLAEYAMTQWRQFAADTRESHSVIVLDAALFGMTLGALLQMDAPRELLTETSFAIEKALKPLNPVMVHLCPRDVETAFNETLSIRGESWASYLAEELSSSAFARTRELASLDLARTYHRELYHLSHSVYEGLSLTKRTIRTGRRDFERARCQILDAVGTGASVPALSSDWLESLSGTYHCPSENSSLTLRPDGQDLVIDREHGARLVHANANEFMVQGMPVEVKFEMQGDRPTRIFFCARTANPTDFPKVWIKI
jgi:hypothetical protein